MLIMSFTACPISQQFEATKYPANKDTRSSCETMLFNPPSSHTPTSASASDDGNDSRLSFASLTSSHDNSAVDINTTNASDKEKPARVRPILSIWTGATLNTTAPELLSPLASIGSANAQPLSPPLARRSRFSHFFSNTEDTGVSDPPESPFFPDGLSGGLVTAMADIKVQQQKMGEDVKSYVTAHYASPSPFVVPEPGTKQWNKYIESFESGTDTMPMTGTGTSRDFVQASTNTKGQGQRSRHISALLDPIGESGHDLIDKSSTKAHKAPTAPFVPRHTNTAENLREAAEDHNGQRSRIGTRTQPTWNQVSNWRTRRQEQNGTWPRHSTYRAGNQARNIRTPSTGGLAQSTTAPRNVPQQSSQALTNIAHPSSSAHGHIGNCDTTTTRRTFEVFRPMNAVLNPDAHLQPLSPEEIAFRTDNGISLNYHGNQVNPRNISANIPDKENCAVWITNLPATCTIRDLLRALMHLRPGRVWASHINPPEEGRHRHAAAKIIFYHPSEAKRFLDLSLQPGIVIENRRMCAIYNKQRVAAQEYSSPTSRALEIKGEKKIVNETFLRSLFERHFRFEDEAVEVLAEFDDVRVIEWRFGSMRAQAGAAYKLLECMYPCVDIRYATDPCAQYMIMPGH